MLNFSTALLLCTFVERIFRYLSFLETVFCSVTILSFVEISFCSVLLAVGLPCLLWARIQPICFGGREGAEVGRNLR